MHRSARVVPWIASAVLFFGCDEDVGNAPLANGSSDESSAVELDDELPLAGGGSPVEIPSTEDDGGDGPPPPPTVRTVEGDVFYDDFRDQGRFSLRDKENGAVGTQVDYTGAGHNYLAGLDMQVLVYEIDGMDNASFDCELSDLQGTDFVDAEGHFQVQVVDDDPCLLDSDDDPDLAVQVKLRYCDELRCFSVGVDDGAPYSLYYSNASPSSPREVSGLSVDVGTKYFQTSNYDNRAKAASLFAAIADGTRKMYVEAGIVTERDDEIVVEFPDDVAIASTNGTTIHVPAPASGWVDGGVLHEFGHAFHFLSWDGDLSSCSTNSNGPYMRDGDGGWSVTSREWPSTAFNEGVATFVWRATLEGLAGGCSTSGFDSNSDPAVVGPTGSPICSADPDEFPTEDVAVTYPNDGKSYARDVTKILCDWYDEPSDNDPRMPGAGDHFVATLASTWQNVTEMYTTVANPDCLDVCSVVDYYLDVRKSVAAVGQQDHDYYVELITDLAYQNGLTCELPSP